MLDKPPAGQHHYRFWATIHAMLHIHAANEADARKRLADTVTGGDALDVDRDDEDADIAASCTLTEEGLTLYQLDGKDVPDQGDADDAWTVDLREVVDGQGDVVHCSCGEPVTEYDGQWLHILNPALTGADDHDADPGG